MTENEKRHKIEQARPKYKNARKWREHSRRKAIARGAQREMRSHDVKGYKQTKRRQCGRKKRERTRESGSALERSR
jgi:hypothetical protein